MKLMVGVVAVAAALVLSSCGDSASSSRDDATEAARTAFIERCADSVQSGAELVGFSGDAAGYIAHCTAMLDCVEDSIGAQGFSEFLAENRTMIDAAARAVTSDDPELRRCIVGF